jgi:hypothetical protein
LQAAVFLFFGGHAGINCFSERTSGILSSVSATKKDTTDENGDDHTTLLMQKHGRSFHPHLFLVLRFKYTTQNPLSPRDS